VGRSNEEFGGYKVHYEGPIYSSLYGDAPDHQVHSVRVTHPKHSDVGHLYWHPQTGEIKDLLVQPDHQGQGLATKMFQVAQQTAATNNLPAPKHSSTRTRAGDSWAKKVGGAIPPLKDGRFHHDDFEEFGDLH
jgi:GNAT superfamily N-acetyltransferase